MISVFIFTSNDFRPWKIEERERARRLPTLEQEDRIGVRRSHRSDRSNPPSSNPVTDHRDRLAIFGPCTKRETERERRESREIVAPPVRSSRHHSRTRSHQIANEPTRTALTNPPLRRTYPSNPRTRDRRTVNLQTHEPANPLPISFEIFVIKFVCDFDFLLSLFDLWFFCCCCGGIGGGVLVVFLLCGGGFCVGSGGK